MTPPASANGEKKFLTWKWLVIVLIPAFGTLGFYMYTDTRAEIKTLQTNKADKDDVERMEKKLDRIYDFLIETHRRKAERDK